MLSKESQADPKAIAKAVGLPAVVGEYATRIVEQLIANEYDFPSDGRTSPAAVYLAARDENEPITAEEVADVVDVGESAITREYRKLKKVRGIVTKPGDPEDFIERYGRELGISDRTVTFALELYRDAEAEGVAIVNRTPGVTAGMCLYAANLYTEEDPDLTLSAFENFGVSEVSVRTNYRELFPLRGGDPRGRSLRMTERDDTGQIVGVIEELHDSFGNVPDVVLDRARDLAEEVSGESWVLGKVPESVAGACYWLAAREFRVQISQKEIADAVEIHKVTVARRIKDLREKTDAGESGSGETGDVTA